MSNNAWIELWADGSCLGNPGVGGWAYLLRYRDREKLETGAIDETTNNRMEMQAIIEGLRAIKDGKRGKRMVTIYTDSQYIHMGWTTWVQAWKKNGWRTKKRGPVANQDLWKELLAFQKKFILIFNWVKGHNGLALHDRVDRAARQAARDWASKA